LLFSRKLGQTKPERENGQDDRRETSQHEEKVTELEQLAGDAGLLGVSKNAANVENNLGKIVDNEENQSKSGESEYVGSSNKCEIEDCILDFWCHVFFLNFLEVELWEDVKPVRDLDDEEKFEEEGHAVVRIAFPN